VGEGDHLTSVDEGARAVLRGKNRALRLPRWKKLAAVHAGGKRAHASGGKTAKKIKSNISSNTILIENTRFTHFHFTYNKTAIWRISRIYTYSVSKLLSLLLFKLYFIIHLI
jgi:hypothetical protein